MSLCETLLVRVAASEIGLHRNKPCLSCGTPVKRPAHRTDRRESVLVPYQQRDACSLQNAGHAHLTLSYVITRHHRQAAEIDDGHHATLAVTHHEIGRHATDATHPFQIRQTGWHLDEAREWHLGQDEPIRQSLLQSPQGIALCRSQDSRGLRRPPDDRIDLLQPARPLLGNPAPAPLQTQQEGHCRTDGKNHPHRNRKPV